MKRFKWPTALASLCALSLTTLPLLGGGCFEGDEAGIAPVREPVGPDEVEANERPDRFPGQGRIRDAQGSVITEIVDERLVKPIDQEELLTGDLSCIGDNLPLLPSGEIRGFSGRTVYFGTSTAVPGTTVRLIDAKGEEIAETKSDDLGRFEIRYPDTADRSPALVELVRPGFFPVRHAATHPEWAWVDGVELGLVSMTEVDIIEVASGVAIDDERGSVHGHIYDCNGESGVAGVTVTIEEIPADVYYATPEFELSHEIDATTASSHFYVFNLQPGVYRMALWGFTEPHQDSPVLINRVAFEVEAGTLTALAIYPE